MEFPLSSVPVASGFGYAGDDVGFTRQGHGRGGIDRGRGACCASWPVGWPLGAGAAVSSAAGRLRRRPGAGVPDHRTPLAPGSAVEIVLNTRRFHERLTNGWSCGCPMARPAITGRAGLPERRLSAGAPPGRVERSGDRRAGPRPNRRRPGPLPAMRPSTGPGCAIDAAYGAQLAEKGRLLADRRDACWRALAGQCGGRAGSTDRGD